MLRSWWATLFLADNGRHMGVQQQPLHQAPAQRPALMLEALLLWVVIIMLTHGTHFVRTLRRKGRATLAADLRIVLLPLL